MKKILKFVARFAIILMLLAGGSVAALYINNMETTKVADPHDHGGGGHDDHGDEKAGHKEMGKDEHAGHGHGGGDAHGDGEADKEITFTPQQLQNANLGIETAGSAFLQPSLRLNGIIIPNEERLVQVSPRFPGIVRKISKRIGSLVKKGDLLVTIEDDQSLKRYRVESAITGTVIERRVGLGEHVDRNTKMMVVADLRTVWVDFRVYPRDFQKMQIGQAIQISLPSGGSVVKAKISYISPIGSSDTQSMLARATVENLAGLLRPGLFVTGQAILGKQQAFVAVKNTAIQYFEAKPVVFVEEPVKAGKSGKRFVATDVELGPSDGKMTEIYFGIVPGQKYVATNSFMLKAEMTKNMAAHSH